MDNNPYSLSYGTRGRGGNRNVKHLDLYSSREPRNELPTDLGCPHEMMNDSVSMNTRLPKTMLQKLAENGGNIPKELLE